MKKMLRMAAALLGALAAAGCQTEKIVEDVQPSGERTLKVIAGSADTRTGIFLDENTGKYKTIWTEDDGIRLIETIYANLEDEAHSIWTYFSGDPALEDGGRKATFDFTLEDNQQYLPENEVFRYLGLYPEYGGFQGAMRVGMEVPVEQWEEFWGETNPSNHLMFLGRIPSHQRPTADSFDPNADIMFSKVVESAVQPVGEFPLSFARIGCIVKITLKGLPSGCSVDSGTFSFGRSWQGGELFLYDPELERVLSASEIDETYIESSSQMTFEPSNVTADQDGNAVIWLRTLSGKLTDWFAINVSISSVGSNSAYTKYAKYVDLEALGKSITFREGTITAFDVTMETTPLIEFDAETTLKYFPELLDPSEPKIKIPKNYDPRDNYYETGWDYGFPIFFDSDFTWDLSIEFPEEYNEEGEWISVEERSRGHYLVIDSDTDLPEEATLVFTCTNASDIPSIRIPIEGVSPVLFKTGDRYFEATEDVTITSGETLTLTADIQLPSWMEPVEGSLVWTVEKDYYEDDQADYVSYDNNQGTAFSMTALDVEEYKCVGFVVFTMVVHDNLTGLDEDLQYQTYLCVVPRSVPLVWHYVDWNGKGLILTPDDEVTIQADLSGIDPDQVESLNWSLRDENRDYIDIDPCEDQVLVFCSTSGDYATLDLLVRMKDGTVYHSECYITYESVKLMKDGVRIYGDPIVLNPGQSCNLSLSIPDYEEDREYYNILWSTVTGRYIGVNPSYYGTNATVYATNPGRDYVSIDIRKYGWTHARIDYPFIVEP